MHESTHLEFALLFTLLHALFSLFKTEFRPLPIKLLYTLLLALKITLYTNQRKKRTLYVSSLNIHYTARRYFSFIPSFLLFFLPVTQHSLPSVTTFRRPTIDSTRQSKNYFHPLQPAHPRNSSTPSNVPISRKKKNYFHRTSKLLPLKLTRPRRLGL